MLPPSNVDLDVVLGTLSSTFIVKFGIVPPEEVSKVVPGMDLIRHVGALLRTFQQIEEMVRRIIKENSQMGAAICFVS